MRKFECEYYNIEITDHTCDFKCPQYIKRNCRRYEVNTLKNIVDTIKEQIKKF